MFPGFRDQGKAINAGRKTVTQQLNGSVCAVFAGTGTVLLTVRADAVTMSMLGNPETTLLSAITGAGRGPVTGIMPGACIRFGREKGDDLSTAIEEIIAHD